MAFENIHDKYKAPRKVLGGGEMAQMVRDGVTVAEIAEATGATPGRVAQVIGHAGYDSRTGERKRKPPLSKDVVERMLGMIQAGHAYTDIADELDIYASQVAYYAAKNGLNRRPITGAGAEVAVNPVGSGFLRALAPVGDWVLEALCAQTDPEIFFPEKGGSTAEAKAVCARCPVAAECLEYALANVERYGIFGGLSERERRRLAKNTPAA